MIIRTSNRSQALTLIEMLVVLVVLGFLVLILWPARMKDHTVSGRIRCLANLKQTALAFRVWSGDNGDRYPAQVYTNQFGEPQFANVFQFFQVMSNELNHPNVLICPRDQNRTAANNFTTDFDDTHVSYFIGLNANVSNENNFLTGDYNLENGVPLKNHLLNLTTNQTVRWTHEVHQDSGNLALTDGSVQQFSNAGLSNALIHTGLATNRLMFPETK